MILSSLMFECFCPGSFFLIMIMLLNSKLQCFRPFSSHQLILNSGFTLVSNFVFAIFDCVQSIIQPICHLLSHQFWTWTTVCDAHFDSHAEGDVEMKFDFIGGQIFLDSGQICWFFGKHIPTMIIFYFFLHFLEKSRSSQTFFLKSSQRLKYPKTKTIK